MQTALALKKSVNQALLDLHKVAASHGDEQVGRTDISVDTMYDTCHYNYKTAKDLV